MKDLYYFDMYLTFILKIFIGNKDRNTPVTSMFTIPLSARFIRINPTDWRNVPAMRFEVLECAGE